MRTPLSTGGSDPAIGRFLAADTGNLRLLIPEPGNPQALNRYAYVLNNPLRYTDPTGMFEEDQLEAWFGKDWRDSFSPGWQVVLLEAEFGDVITNEDQMLMFVHEGSDLSMWNINTLESNEISAIVNNFNADEFGLYRTTDVASFHRLRNTPMSFMYKSGNPNFGMELILPSEWYRGLDQHVDFGSYISGIQLDYADGAGIVALTYAALKVGVREAIGGPVGFLALMVEIQSWLEHDQWFTVSQGTGFVYHEPVPAPEPRGKID